MTDKVVNMASKTLKEKSGIGMDRKIEKKRNLFSARNIMIAAGVIGSIVFYMFFAPEGGRVYKIDGDRIIVAPVVMGQFEDFIPVRGRVIPARTVFLDTVEGGRVERIYVEDGANVVEGQILVDLPWSRLPSVTMPSTICWRSMGESSRSDWISSAPVPRSSAVCVARG